MGSLRKVVVALVGVLMLTSASLAGDSDPLFVNLTTDSAHRAQMAVVFAKNQLDRKHPVTIFLNDRAVMLGAKSKARQFKAHQTMLAEMVKQGATVLICPMCMKHYGVKDGDVIDGIKVGNPELTGGALFKDNTKSITW